MGSKDRRVVGAGSLFKGGNTSSERWLSRVDAGKWAQVILEWSMRAPFFKGGNESRCWQMGTKGKRVVGACSLFEVRTHLIGKLALESRRWQMGTSDSRVVGAGSLFQGRQHLTRKLALGSRRRQMGTSDSRVVGAGSLFQGRQHLIRKLTFKS
jgi:hypothetical protein